MYLNSAIIWIFSIRFNHLKYLQIFFLLNDSQSNQSISTFGGKIHLIPHWLESTIGPATRCGLVIGVESLNDIQLRLLLIARLEPVPVRKTAHDVKAGLTNAGAVLVPHFLFRGGSPVVLNSHRERRFGVELESGCRHLSTFAEGYL